MNNPIWVLQINGRLSVSGVQTVLMNFYRNVDRSKVQFAFAVQRDYPFDYDSEIYKLGGRVHYLPDMIENPSLFKKKLEELLNEHEEYKIVHCHYNFKNIEMLQIAKKCGITVRISHAHSMMKKERLTTKIHLWLQSYLLRKNATDLIACSKAAGRFLYCVDDFSVIHNAIDLNSYRFDEEKRIQKRLELGVDDEVKVIGQIGHINENKNQLFSLRLLKKINIPFKFFIVGTGELEEEVKSFVKKNGLEENVVFLGVRDDVHELLQAFDLVLVPSHHEGLSIVAVESMAAGVPVLASTNLPKEIEISKLIQRIDLEDESKWKEQITYSHPFDRKLGIKDVEAAGYDIKKEALVLQGFYIDKFNSIKR